MSTRTIVDTGPLVAFFNRRDAHHDWAADQFKRLKVPWLTCESVLSETCFLLKSMGVAPELALEAVERGAVKPCFLLADEIAAVHRLMRRYAKASLADACLVRMSELYPDCQVLTLDRDFLIYRRDGRRVIPLIAPFHG